MGDAGGSVSVRTRVESWRIALAALALPGPALALPSTTIVIQQVEADAPAIATDASHEWFELRNVSAFTQTLAGWTIADNFSSVSIPAVELPPACSVIVASDVLTFDADYLPFHGQFVVGLGQPIGSGLANGGDRLLLTDNLATLVDCVSYGSDVGCLLPAPLAANPTNTLQRNPPGTDTDTSGDWASMPRLFPGVCNGQVFVDGFETGDRRRWSIPDCGLGTFVNETDFASEMDYCNLQFPTSLNVSTGQPTDVFGQVYEADLTPDPGPNGSILAQLGFGPQGSDPTLPATMCAWSWVNAAFNVQQGNNDEYVASLVAPAIAGTYWYTFRFSRNGTDWTICDTDGAGSDAGLGFSTGQLPVMTVVSPP